MEATRFVSIVEAPADVDIDNATWFLFHGSDLVVEICESAPPRLPIGAQFSQRELAFQRQHYLGQVDEQHCFVAELSEAAGLPANWRLHGLRSTWGLLDDELFAIAGRAFQVIDWDRNHRFCGRCGETTKTMVRERGKECLHCGLVSYPRVSPAVIMLIEREGKALLARNKRASYPFYSCLAGFVEVGESLENAVRREVLEETGIEVTGIRYFGSQPWPFPHSLMIGFTAVYASGEISPDDDEIADANWFASDDLPTVPAPLSIARQLIDDFVRRHNGPLNQPGLLAWRTEAS